MKVIVTDEISEKGLELLENDPRVQLDVRLGLETSELHGLIGDYDAIITRSGTQVDAELLSHATNLKMVARAGVGIDNVDVVAAKSVGVWLRGPVLSRWMWLFMTPTSVRNGQRTSVPAWSLSMSWLVWLMSSRCTHLSMMKPAI